MFLKKIRKSKKIKLLKKRTNKLLNSSEGAKIFVAGSLLALFSTTTLWSFLSAKLQAANADQLINVFLFEDFKTFENSEYPGAHTFLIKWPLFYLIKVLGSSSAAFVLFTVLVSLIAVGTLAFILYRIERRPFVFGTFCLALSSALLLVPTHPYPGALLPTNFAMITTRNIEYSLYFFAVFLFIKSPDIRHKYFWLSATMLGFLIASDKLFFSISLAGALAAAAFYAITKKPKQYNVSLGWVLLSLSGFIIATFILFILKFSWLPDVVNGSNLSPFSITGDLKTLALGIVYAVLSIVTNFGANPIFGTIVLREMPQYFISNIHLWTFSYLVNLFTLAAVTIYSFKLFVKDVKSKYTTKLEPTKRFSIILIWTGLATIFAYIFTEHYFAADSRYITILFFALFIGAATYISQIRLNPVKVVLASSILLLSVLFGVIGSISNYNDERNALREYDKRNSLVADAIEDHKVDALVGDYWRVVPTKYQSDKKINIIPQVRCLENADSLTSKSWNVDLRRHSFAYLLTRDISPTNYLNCSAEEVIEAYGYPNSSILISGTLGKPKEQLLFYDDGIHQPPPVKSTNIKESNTIVPTEIEKMKEPDCAKRKIMNVAAHEDDDLLFMSPDLLHDVQEGNCVTTVYLTAGDAGKQGMYWLGRERGSEAAYNSMLKSTSPWTERVVKLGDRQFVTLASPKEHPQITLIFMHLPDGSTGGTGFKSSKFESLEKLDAGQIAQVHSVDKQSVYTAQQLVGALHALINFYQPAEFRTQANLVDSTFPDHSDHMAVGRFAQRAYGKYMEQKGLDQSLLPIKFYIGYPVQSLEMNVFDRDLHEKEGAFMMYSQFDPAVCRTNEECATQSTLKMYVERQYQNPY